MFKKISLSTLVGATFAMGIASAQTLTEEQTILKATLENTAKKTVSTIASFKELSSKTQNRVLNILANAFTPKNITTQEQFDAYQNRMQSFINADKGTKEFIEEIMNAIRALTNEYIQFLIKTYQDAQKTLSQEEMSNLEIILNQKAIGIEHTLGAMFYDSLYNFLHQTNAGNLIALIDAEGNDISNEKRSVKLPSMEELQQQLIAAQAAFEKANA